MNGHINNITVLNSALAQFQKHLTGALVAITVELPGYSGIGVTTRAIVNRNLLLWGLPFGCDAANESPRCQDTAAKTKRTTRRQRTT